MLSVVHTLLYIIYSIASIFRIRIHNHPSRCIVIMQWIRPTRTVCSPPYMCPVCTKSIVIFSYIYVLLISFRPSSRTLEFQCPLFDRLIRDSPPTQYLVGHIPMTRKCPKMPIFVHNCPQTPLQVILSGVSFVPKMPGKWGRHCPHWPCVFFTQNEDCQPVRSMTWGRIGILAL